MGNGNDTIEARHALFLRHVLQFGEEKTDAFRVGRIFTGIARGYHAGCAVQRIHFNAGVIGQGQQTALRGQDAGFELRIFTVRVACFLDCRGDYQFFRGRQVELNAFQQTAVFFDLTGIVCR